jgi:translocation and assembly module TamA
VNAARTSGELRRHPRARPGWSSGFTLGIWCIGLLRLLAASQAFAASQIAYDVTIVGIEDRNLLTAAESLLDSVTLRQNRPPATLGLLRQRVERDVPRLVNLLKSAGYFGAQVTTTIDSKAEPVGVRFQVESGPVYRLKSLVIQTATEPREPPPELPGAKELGFAVGEPVRSGALVEGEIKLLSFLRSRGFPFPEITERRVVVDHDDRSVAVTIEVAPGPEATFGPTTVQGLDSVERDFVEGKIPWRQGDRYDGDLVAKLRRQLSETGLFSVVQVTPAQRLDERGELPVTVTAAESKQRTVSAGVGYRTDEGLGTTASWEHRNLFHRAERLTVTATLADIVKSLEATFRKPTLGREERRLILGLRLAEEYPEAYSSRSVASSARLEQDIAKGMTVGGGVGFKLSKVGQQGEDENFASISFPLSFGWDASNDLLNPTRGGRLVVQVAPYQDLITTDLRFLKMSASTTHYLEVTSAPSLVLAGRAAAGTILGASRHSIPADERFYAGGAGSIRGYPYQTVGPLVDDKPVGGRSVVELSLEARLRLTERFGLVAFLDGGTALATGLFESGETFRWGTGAGVRYFTPIGPFRLDVGFPLDRRSGVDDSFQFYVSLGQAF